MRIPIVLSTFLVVAYHVAPSQQYGEKIEKFTKAGRIGLTVTNIGVIGNSFRGPFLQGAPSCEFPIGSGIEHLFDGGLWIGANVRGEDIVSTGAAGDDANGYDPGNAGYEFTFASAISERSSLFSSPFYNPLAVSHQDFVTSFTDTLTIVPGSTVSIDQHTKPLGAVVRLESYAWNFSFADFFVILNYRITNTSQDPWSKVYLGLWADFVVRNVKITAPRGTDFFSHGANAFLDSSDLIYTYNYNADIGFADNYVGAVVLGGTWRNVVLKPKTYAYWPDSLKQYYRAYPPEDTSGLKVNYQFWGFRSTELETGSPRNDAERYGKMRTSIKRDLVEGPGGMRVSPGNRLSLISMGPVPVVNPGESIEFAVAVVAAPFGEPRQVGVAIDTATESRLRKALAENTAWAQRAYNGEDRNGNGILDPGEDSNGDGIINRFRLPTPPLAPRVRVVASSQQLTVYWDKGAEESVDPITSIKDFEGYRIYRTNAGSDLQIGVNILDKLQLIAEFDSSGNSVGPNAGIQTRGSFQVLPSPQFFAGDMTAYYYKYDINNLLNGWQYIVAVTAYDEGNAEQNLEPLESSRFISAVWAIPGTTANDNFERGPVGVYPNPYYTRTTWDGSSERDKKIYFYNLPSDCEIGIYTLAGETVDVVHHRSDYSGSDVRWFTTFSGEKRVMAGGEHAWDLISRFDQRIATGLYLFTVKDNMTGNIQRGKFAVIR
ncbi:MAG: hypothetical protein HY562_00890 [Ignavibacteriales bacterium]|nr:hypothetical protein [Ignavibacteriales bacterium]